jgi:hypothetical protein
VRARVAAARRMLAASPEEFDATLPGLFASEPPPRFLPLLREIAADVRPETLTTQLPVMADTDQGGLLPRIAVPTLPDLGRARCTLAAQRRAPVRAGDPGCEARHPSWRRTREQSRAARTVQRRRAYLLPNPPAASGRSDTTALSVGGHDRLSERERLLDRSCAWKPSDGLEPSTPSLPWRFGSVARVHARSRATLFRLQIGPSDASRKRRETSRVSFLMCPFTGVRQLMGMRGGFGAGMGLVFGLRRSPGLVSS